MNTTCNQPSYNPNTQTPRAKFHDKEEEDVDAWFFALVRYFRKNNTQIILKVDTAVDYLRDAALVTFRSLDNWDSISWDQFRNAFYTTYQPQNLQKVLRKRLSSLKP